MESWRLRANERGGRGDTLGPAAMRPSSLRLRGAFPLATAGRGSSRIQRRGHVGIGLPQTPDCAGSLDKCIRSALGLARKRLVRGRRGRGTRLPTPPWQQAQFIAPARDPRCVLAFRPRLISPWMARLADLRIALKRLAARVPVQHAAEKVHQQLRREDLGGARWIVVW